MTHYAIKMLLTSAQRATVDALRGLDEHKVTDAHYMDAGKEVLRATQAIKWALFALDKAEEEQNEQ